MSGCVANGLKREAGKAGVFWGVSVKSTRKHELTVANQRFNRKISSVRSLAQNVLYQAAGNVLLVP